MNEGFEIVVGIEGMSDVYCFGDIIIIIIGRRKRRSRRRDDDERTEE